MKVVKTWVEGKHAEYLVDELARLGEIPGYQKVLKGLKKLGYTIHVKVSIKATKIDNPSE